MDLSYIQPSADQVLLVVLQKDLYQDLRVAYPKSLELSSVARSV